MQNLLEKPNHKPSTLNRFVDLKTDYQNCGECFRQCVRGCVDGEW
jgi:hypothetical protein